MINFNEFWDAESVRRRKLWPARYKSILARHLSTEDIKKQVFSEGPNNVSPSVLHRRHICDSNPFISSDDNSSFSEERLRRRLEALGADTRTLSIKTDVRYSAHYKQTYKDVKEIADIHLEEIVVRIKKCYRDDKKDSSDYLVFPYIGRMKHCDNMEYDQDGFNHLDTATLLMEMVADYNLRKEEFLYYSKRQRMDNMCGIVADDITFKLLDDEKLKEKVKRCIEKRFDEERMFREVARSWLIATKKYITLVTEAEHDAMYPKYNQVRSAVKEIDKDSLVFLTERNDLIVDLQGNTCRLEDPYGWKGKKISFHFFSDFPCLTIEFRGVSTKALIGYLRQAAGFNKSMMEYLRKARKWYRQLKNMDTEEYSYEVMLPQTNKVIMGSNYKYIKKLTIPETATKVHELGGLYIAAHVDRANHSVIGALGAIPEPLVESEAQPDGGKFFDAVELSRTADAALWLPKVEGYAVTRSSDAHNLDGIARVWTEADIPEFTIAALRRAFADKATAISPRLTTF